MGVRKSTFGWVSVDMRGVRTPWQRLARRKFPHIHPSSARVIVVEGRWLALHRARRKPRPTRAKGGTDDR
jgi:hypothetical protein